MRPELKSELMKMVENAVYMMWIREALLRGHDAEKAHRIADQLTKQRMQEVSEAWLTSDWMPSPDDRKALEPDSTDYGERLRRLFNSTN